MTRNFLALGAIASLAFAVACSATTAESGEVSSDNDASATWAYGDPDASSDPPTISDAGVVVEYDASANDASASYDSSCPPPPPPPPPCGCGGPDASADDDASSDPVPVLPD